MVLHAPLSLDNGMTAQSPAPLAGKRVLDLSRVLAGPWCTMILADLGAEVIKVEEPTRGDDTRAWGPPWAAGESAYYLCANRNKQSVSIDITCAAGQAAVRALAAQSDVVVENFKLGGLDKYGLDYASLSAINPKLIYCSISGYGRESPLADLPGYDYVIQAAGGLMSINGGKEEPPVRVGVAVADLFTGMTAAQAVLAALIAVDRDGVGQLIDLALYDCQLAMLANVGSGVLVSGEEGKRWGNQHSTVVPYQTFSTLDGHVVIAVGNDRQFRAFMALIGLKALGTDDRFATNAARVVNRDALIALLIPPVATQTTAYWLDILAKTGVPGGPVRRINEALNAPEAQARQMVRHVAHPTAGEVPLIASPLRFSETPVIDPVAPPLLGQHSADVLGRLLGYDAESVRAAAGAA
jgi:crotonobetainyl-CoA:carnitine CoA-transferase CaiB-like acyl-CoA transferase